MIYPLIPLTHSREFTLRIAIIGSGISGLSAAYMLHKHHDITLFEADSRIGGHTNTVDVKIADKPYSVDTGFIVFNNKTYPNFIKLMDELGVESQDAPMGFSVVNETSGLQYSSAFPGGIFAQPKNLLKPRFIKMLRDILRFMRNSEAIMANGDSRSLGQYLREEGYSKSFIEDYLLPIGSAIWSAPLEVTGEFPVDQFVHFFHNHGLLSVKGNVQWRTITGGSKQYVEKMIQPFKQSIRLSSPVSKVRRSDDGVWVTAGSNEPERFDEVIFGCHSDQALAMIDNPSDAEQQVLGDLPYQDNEAVLHTDSRLLPSAKRAASGWNYRVRGGGDQNAQLSYNMNFLQNINCPETLIVSLNQTERINPNRILYTTQYAHPVYNIKSTAARQRWADISGVDKLHFCGAYWTFGFHEDGVKSAIRVVDMIGGQKLTGKTS